MVQELLKAFLLIFIAEMGDKTQILAMAFATKYPAKKVLAGIFAGCLINHGLAVLLGSYISKLIPLNTVQIIAGFAFVGFALWTLKPESDEDEDENKKSKFGPVITVAAAFFIGELGDKTQLTAITLATDAVYPLVILAGTVSGMLVTGGMGIIVGKKLGDKIPEFAIKIIAASVFMLFGVTKLYNTMPEEYLGTKYILPFAVVISAVVFWLIRGTIIRRREGKESPLIKTSRELYNYYHQARKKVEDICLGEGKCGNCQGKNCIIGYTKLLIENGLESMDSVELDEGGKNFNKDYDKDSVLETLRITLAILKNDPNNDNYSNLHRIRKNLEIILLGKSLGSMNNWQDYVNKLGAINRDVADKLVNGIK
ncbi:MAG TPA: TMEM165/GDT1 family protein [Pseudobacteroides sp.]|uniref:TMEM165/GDT1 family protein n=1 Tax=Pseudobacteroides sp. TaxID=1968840 RepID=UPI002F93CB6F